MKPKTPVFTYILIFLNSALTASIVSVLGSAFVLVNSETGETVSFIELHYPVFIFGFQFCIGLSLLYYLLIRKKRFRPRWWSNILLLLTSYLSIPLAALIVGSSDLIKGAVDQLDGLVTDAFMLSTLGFIVISLLTRRNSTESVRKPRFQSAFWIAPFALACYICFFLTLMLMSIFLDNECILTAKFLHQANQLLRLPFYNPLTKDLVAQHLPGARAHLVFIGNSIIWGSATWLILKTIYKQKSEPPALPSA